MTLWPYFLIPCFWPVSAGLSPCGRAARSRFLRRGLLLATACGACAILHVVTGRWRQSAGTQPGAWLALDAPGLLFLSITSALFLVAAVYAVGYLRRESGAGARDFEEGFLFDNEPEAGVHRLPAAVPGGDDAGDGQPASGRAVGGGRGDHAGQLRP